MPSVQRPDDRIENKVMRRTFLKMAGCCAAGFALEGGARAKESSEPQVHFFCGNTPTGNPYFADDRSTQPFRNKGVFDPDKRWPVLAPGEARTDDLVKIRVLLRPPYLVDLRPHVKDAAEEWKSYANVDFEWVDEDCHISISFTPSNPTTPPSANCFIGTDAKAYIKTRSTMNLLIDKSVKGKWNEAGTQAEVRRMILHEFGHALGMIHEHQNPTANIQFTSEIYEYGKNAWGFDKDMVDEDVIKPYQGAVVGSAFDRKSIMQYDFDPQAYGFKDPVMTVGGVAVVNKRNMELSPSDKVVASILYPAGGELREEPLTIGKGGSGQVKTGEVARFSFETGAGGKFKITATGMPCLLALLEPRKTNETLPTVQIASESKTGDAATLDNLDLEAQKTYRVQVRHAQHRVQRASSAPFSIKVEKA